MTVYQFLAGIGTILLALYLVWHDIRTKMDALKDATCDLAKAMQVSAEAWVNIGKHLTGDEEDGK